MKILKSLSKNYRRIAILQIILIFCVLTMGDFFNAIHIPSPDKWVVSVLLILEAVYLILLVNLAGALHAPKRATAMISGSIAIIFILSLIALNPFIELVTDTVPWLIAIHILLCSIECYLIALGLMDIYSSDIRITERLWGSVSVYLMIILGWASFFEVIVLCTPDSFGPSLIPGFQTYSESLYFSMCSLSGISSVYTNPSHIIRNLALIEGVWGVLYLVMLIGRLFTLTDKEK